MDFFITQNLVYTMDSYFHFGILESSEEFYSYSIKQIEDRYQ